MSKQESHQRTIYPNRRIIYHGRTIKKNRSSKDLPGNAGQSSEKKQTLEQNLNKEKIQRKGKRREKCKTSGQNTHGKTETCLHDKHILAAHMALNCSNIKTAINAQYTE